VTSPVFVRKAARADIVEAFAWYEERSVGLGHEFLRAVRVGLRAIERTPLQFSVAVDDVRRARLRRFPYSIYFVILQHHVSVIAVTHGHRDPRRWQSRR
jgi:plasmid stabilization system protein ParE